MIRRTSRSTNRRRRAEHGASVVEYALIVAGAALAFIGGVVVLSGGLRTAFEASARGAEAGVTIDQEAAGSNESAAVPEVTAKPSPSDIPSETASPSATETPAPTPTATTPSATPTPTPTRPKGAVKVGAGDEADPVDIDVPEGARGFTATIDPESAGGAYLDKDDQLVFEAAKRATSQTLVTVSWGYSYNGKLVTGTTRYWIE